MRRPGQGPQPDPTHREVLDAEGVLQEALEGHGPAGGPPVPQAPAALRAREAGVAAQAVAAHAVLQVGAVQLWGPAQTSPASVSRSCPRAAARGSRPQPSLAHAPGTEPTPKTCPVSFQAQGTEHGTGGCAEAHTQQKGRPLPGTRPPQEGAPEGVHREVRWSRRSGRGRQDLGLPPSPDRTSPRKPHTHTCARSAPDGSRSGALRRSGHSASSHNVSVTAHDRPPRGGKRHMCPRRLLLSRLQKGTKAV